MSCELGIVLFLVFVSLLGFVLSWGRPVSPDRVTRIIPYQLGFICQQRGWLWFWYDTGTFAPDGGFLRHVYFSEADLFKQLLFQGVRVSLFRGSLVEKVLLMWDVNTAVQAAKEHLSGVPVGKVIRVPETIVGTNQPHQRDMFLEVLRQDYTVEYLEPENDGFPGTGTFLISAKG